MRLRLTLRSLHSQSVIPIDYQYYLSSAIYRWIEISSPDFSKFLHDTGYSTETLNRCFKHFCFSRLFIQNSRVVGSAIYLNGGSIHWLISMPIQEALHHLVIGLFEKQKFFIDRKENEFCIEQVEALPDPIWERQMKFKTLSPITVSIMQERNGKLLPRYLKADDPKLSESLRKNLLHRYESLYKELPNDTELKCTMDEEYIVRCGGVDKVSKLVTIKKGLPQESKVRGFLCPVALEGSIDLIRLAYASGLGEKGSVGFGMMETV
jgi:CRISPR-associated endoribonuclease Cas6